VIKDAFADLNNVESIGYSGQQLGLVGVANARSNSFTTFFLSIFFTVNMIRIYVQSLQLY